MYAREANYSRYYCQYLKREKKVKAGRRLLALTLAVTIIGSTAAIAQEIPKLSAWLAADDIEAMNEDVVTEAEFIKDVSAGESVVVEEIAENPAGTEVIAGTETPVVFVDAGHGGEDEGCARDGVQEKVINLEIAKLVQSRLEELGYEVVMAREDDTYIAKEDRVVAANQAQADIYISIHQNASEINDASGIEVWYDGTDTSRDSKRLAQLMWQQTMISTGTDMRELRGDADFHVTGKTTMPACLVECGFLSNTDERLKLDTPEYREQIAAGIVQGIEYYFHPKTMYLTFDDGPSEENTARVLDILKERNIKATFFLIGENVRNHPEMAQRIVAEGHTIGIHCYNHDYEKVYESVESYIQDFETARQTVYEVTGVDAKLFRFPGGSINAYNKGVSDEIIEKMTEMGYIYYDWNASMEDAVKDPDPEILITNGLSSTLGRKKVVMLAHDVVYTTGICLERMLDGLPEYEMKPLSEEVTPIQFNR
ncbi:MAG: N-acetylmuramoyl-L-alanine amidase [Lachnospiraceae bacterium]|nr:N-acetylmuramoyl-L-alanine amidase [Lachnospiraceae bacterium]